MSDYVVDFRSLTTAANLAAAIGCSEALIIEVASAKPQVGLYTEHRIPKKNKKRKDDHRIVLEPGKELKEAQRALARRLEDFARQFVSGYPGVATHGFVRWRGTKSNAAVHVGAPILLRADIRTFFRAISIARVQATFSRIGMNAQVSELLARFVTIDNELREGPPTSPLIANLCSMPMDEDFIQLASVFGCKYTRYADDLTFSGNGRLPSKTRIEQVLARYGFELAPRKYRITKIGQAHFVTGLNVGAPPHPRAPRGLKRRLRQEVYYAGKYGIRSHAERSRHKTAQFAVNSIDGGISYLLSVEPTAGVDLRKDWEDVLTRERVSPTYTYPGKGMVSDLHCFVDETFLDDKQTIMAVGLVLVDAEGVSRLRQAAQKTLSDYRGDPFSAGRKPILNRKGLHYTDNAEDLRTKYIQVLSEFPLRAYIAYKKADGDLKGSFRELLRRLLRDRFGRYWASRIAITIEKGPYASQRDAEEICSTIVDDLRRGVRGPLFLPSVAVLGKAEETCLTAVDFLLGVFRSYSVAAQSDELFMKRFERVRDKIRLIHDVDGGHRYWRKKPYPGGLFRLAPA